MSEPNALPSRPPDFEGWLEGPARDGVRRIRMKVRIWNDDDGVPTVEIVDVEDATEWEPTQ